MLLLGWRVDGPQQLHAQSCACPELSKRATKKGGVLVLGPRAPTLRRGTAVTKNDPRMAEDSERTMT
jgi:hypothetical protein